MLLTINLHEYFIDIERITKTLVTAFQTSSVLGSKLVAPQPDGFIADDNTSFSQQIFDISMTQAKAMIKPYSILNDFRWKSVMLVRCG